LSTQSGVKQFHQQNRPVQPQSLRGAPENPHLGTFHVDLEHINPDDLAPISQGIEGGECDIDIPGALYSWMAEGAKGIVPIVLGVCYGQNGGRRPFRQPLTEYSNMVEAIDEDVAFESCSLTAAGLERIHLPLRRDPPGSKQCVETFAGPDVDKTRSGTKQRAEEPELVRFETAADV
jgi:hypothetical protein